MSPLLLMVLTFVAVVLAVLGVYSVLADLFLRDRSRVSRRVDEEFRQRLRDQVRRSALFKDLASGDSEPLDPDDLPGLRQRFVVMVDQSGLKLTPNHLLTFMAIAGLLGVCLGFLIQGNILGGAFGALLGFVPYLYVAYKRKARLAKLLSQLPDTFDLLSRVLRAGQTVSQAFQAIADEFDAPIASEFSYCYEQQNLGLPPEVTLRDLAHRTGLLEIKIFVLALLVQQQVGGNLAELLDNLAHIVRERFRVRGKISALTAEGRMQALVLLALPPALFGLMLLMNRRYGQVLLDSPNLLLATVAFQLFGALWMRKITNFDF